MIDAKENVAGVQESFVHDTRNDDIKTINQFITSSTNRDFWIENVSLSQSGNLIKINYENIMDFYNMNFNSNSNPNIQNKDYERQKQNIDNLLKNGVLDKKENLEDSFTKSSEILSLIFFMNRREMKKQSNIIMDTIKNSIPEELSEIEKTKFIFDYLRFSFKYDTDFFNYAASTSSDCSYEIKDGIVTTSIPLKGDKDEEQHQNSETETALVCNNGVCRGIALLFNKLCANSGIKSDFVLCYYNNIEHILNLVTLADGKKSFADVTRIIRGDLKIEECFLVDKETLENHGYTLSYANFDQSNVLENEGKPITTTTIDRREISKLEEFPPYNINDVILNIIKVKKENNCYLNPSEQSLIQTINVNSKDI